MATDPRPDHLVALPDGRALAVDVRGPGGGPPVVLLHAAPGSRRLDADPAVTAAVGIRLITPDRPGYGASTALADGVAPSVAGMADDVARALGALGVDDVAVVGWSGGGRVALALAARHPDLVRSVAVVATPAPDDEVPWVPEEHRAMVGPMRRDPAAAVAPLAAALAGFVDAPETAVDSISGGAADAAALADPARRAIVVDMLAEAFRTGSTGLALDIVADQAVPWGFDVAAVGAPVTFFYGDDDDAVPPAHGRWYAARTARSDLRVVAGPGHLVLLSEWAAILDAVAP